MKKIIPFSFFGCAAVILVIFLTHHLNDGFSLNKITLKQGSLPANPRPRDDDPKEMAHLLGQKFYYLGKGSQCFVFESEDKQTVLKFFRLSRYQPTFVSQMACSPPFLKDIQQKKRDVKAKKLADLIASCELAMDELQEECGLIYIHLHKTFHLKQNVVVYDKLKRAYSLNLDDQYFILQKQGEHIFFHLSSLLNKGKREEAKIALIDLADLLVARLQKGISDHDAVIHKNSGFLGNKAFFIDIGSFYKEPCVDLEKELFHTTADLRGWLKKYDEGLNQYFEAILKFKSRHQNV